MAQLPLQPHDPAWGTDHDRKLHVVVVAPEIAQNTGSIARLCAATGAHLHLVEPLTFSLDDSKLKRAGLDYWPNVAMSLHGSFDGVAALFGPSRLHLFSSHGETRYDRCSYRPGDVLVFGRESKGLGSEILDRFPQRIRWIPIRREAVRSINLSCAVAVALYEAVRQLDGLGEDVPSSSDSI